MEKLSKLAAQYKMPFDVLLYEQPVPQLVTVHYTVADQVMITGGGIVRVVSGLSIAELVKHKTYIYPYYMRNTPDESQPLRPILRFAFSSKEDALEYAKRHDYVVVKELPMEEI